MGLFDFDMALSDTEARPKPTKRPRGPPRLRAEPAAPARQAPKPKATGSDGAKGRIMLKAKLSAKADTGHRADGLRPPTLAELRCLPSASLAPLTDFRTGGVIAVGADCAGLLSEALALDYLGVEHKHKFAAESNAKLRRLLYWKFGKGSMLFYRNVILRDNTKSEAPRAHLYVFGNPHQPFSPAGKRQGLRDQRGQILHCCLGYIKHKKPLIAVAENSAALATKR